MKISVYIQFEAVYNSFIELRNVRLILRFSINNNINRTKESFIMKTATIIQTAVQAQRQVADVFAPMFINAPRKHNDNTPSNALLEIWKS